MPLKIADIGVMMTLMDAHFTYTKGKWQGQGQGKSDADLQMTC